MCITDISGVNTLVVLLSMLFFISCASSEEQDEDMMSDDQMMVQELLTGEQLAQKYCQSCHLFPEPETLDKKTWERSVLPLMGRLFGIYEENADRNRVLEGAINRELVIQKNIFPERQLISDEEWEKINEFYISNAPDSLPSISREKPITNLERFEPIQPITGSELSMLTMVKIDSEQSRIYVGGARGDFGYLSVLNQNFELLESIPLPSPPVDIDVQENQLTLTLIGTLRLEPSGNSFGGLVQLIRGPGEENYAHFSKFPDDLNRPVQTVITDINGNGYDDLLISEFGYYTGSLTLYEHNGEGSTWYTRTVIKDVPGAVRAYVKDMNGNGQKDIVALFAQGDEGISIFYNDGSGGFKEDRVLRFNPSYGSVYFELVDFNKNGHLDIIYCNGDNGDYPPILKDYHGIRIFENDGENQFDKVYFFPMYGVYRCSAADFNNNGLLDIAAVSFFPDDEGDSRQDFIYMKNQGNYNYIPKILDTTKLSTRWISFDIADIDGDGYKDILLTGYGAFHRQTESEAKEYTSLLLLRNLGAE
jgi:hypothetical protein